MLPPIVLEAISSNGSMDTSRMHQLLTRYLNSGESIPRSGKLLLQYITEHAEDIQVFLESNDTTGTRGTIAEAVDEEAKQEVATESFDDMLPMPGSYLTAAASARVATNAAEESLAQPKAAVAEQHEAAAAHEEDGNTCSNSLMSEATERLLAVIATSFKTDTGQVMLENDMSMLHEILMDERDPSNQYSNMQKWVVDTLKEWESRMHSSVFDEFKHALELWALATFHNQY